MPPASCIDHSVDAHNHMAKLYFNYSTMNAGKSTLLLQAAYNYRERGMQTYLLTAQMDTRAGQGKIASRIGIEEKADTFNPHEDMFQKVKKQLDQGPVACIFIDEAQFLTKDQVWALAPRRRQFGYSDYVLWSKSGFHGRIIPRVGSSIGLGR
jgi:thymidine kinase